MKRLIGPVLAGVGVLAMTSSVLHAGVTIEIRDTGPDVAVSASGTLNLTDLTDSIGSFLPSSTGLIDYGGALGSSQGLVLGAMPSTYVLRSGVTFTGPQYPFFGAERDSQRQIFFSSAVGDLLSLGYSESSNRVGVAVASGYMGGDLMSSATWSGLDLAELGVAANSSYTWTWGSGATRDFLTITVVPEPSAYALMLAGLGLVGFAARVLRRA
jgi:hypothetical protein